MTKDDYNSLKGGGPVLTDADVSIYRAYHFDCFFFFFFQF